MTLGVKFLKVPIVAIFIILLLFLFIAEVPIVKASTENLSKGNANASQILPVVLPHKWSVHPPIHVRGGLSPAIFPPGLIPAQIKKAYNLPSTGGSGTIAIVDAFDDPNVESDLGMFTTHWSSVKKFFPNA